MSEEEKKEYSEVTESDFIIEKIEDKRHQKRVQRIVTLCFVIICAVVFGAVARIVFMISGKAISDAFGIKEPENRGQVQVQSNTTNTPTPTAVLITATPKPTSSIIAKATNTPKVTPTPKATPKVTATVTAPVTPEITPTPEVVPTQGIESTNTPAPTPIVTEGVAEPTGEPGSNPDPEITPSPSPDEENGTTDGEKPGKTEFDYVKFMGEVKKVAHQVSDTVVSIKAITEKQDWFGSTYEVVDHSSGLILAQDGVGILILTDYSTIANVTSIQVGFGGAEGTVVPGELYSYDVDLDIAIVNVNVDDVDPELFETLKYAVICKEEDVTTGSPVFALGSPIGIQDSMSFGIITSSGNSLMITDGEVVLFTADWNHYYESSGFVFDMNGYVMGMLTHQFELSKENSYATCVTLFSIKDEIDLLINGERLVRFGIKGISVPKEVMEASGVNNGIYVNGVVVGSPAYQAGLRVGDIILSINGQKMEDMKQFMDVLTSSHATEALNVSYYRYYSDGSREQSGYIMLTNR